MSLLPKLRFDKTEVELTPYPLSSFIQDHNSGVYKSKNEYGSGTKIVGVGDLFSIDFVGGQEFRRVPLSSDEKNKFLLSVGDIIYAESSLVRSGIAKAVYVTEAGSRTAFAWHTRRMKINERRANSACLYYYLESPFARKYIQSVATQTALTGITTKDYFKTPIFLPPLPEQEKIADFLTAVDDKIAGLRERERLLTLYKKGVMQKIFAQDIRFKADDGSEFSDWEDRKLGDVTEFYKGRGISKADIVENGEFECIRYGEIYTRYSEIITKVNSKTNTLREKQFLSQDNDVIIPASG